MLQPSGERRASTAGPSERLGPQPHKQHSALRGAGGKTPLNDEEPDDDADFEKIKINYTFGVCHQSRSIHTVPTWPQ